VKIGSFPGNVIPISTGVRGKRGGGENARQQYDPNQTRRDSQDAEGDQRHEREQPAFDPKLIDEALESFKTDAAAQASGLSATAEGSGPGLKVSVKDCNGTTLRQFSGEEFLRLREAANGPAPGALPTGLRRGKLLDQKL
jgi:hypothetical protein